VAAGRSPDFIAGYLARGAQAETAPDMCAGSLLFEVELDLGGGQVVPIQMREGVDAETVAADVACMHRLSDAQERHVANALRLVAQSVAPERTQGSLRVWN